MLTIAEKEGLAREHQKLVFFVANRFRSSGQELDELVGEAQVGMVKAFNRYEKDSGIKFTTFAVRCMENEILRLIRSANTKMRKGTVYSLESTVFRNIRIEDILPVPESDVDWKTVNDAVNRVLANRSSRDRDIYRMLMKGEKQRVIGGEHNLTQNRVSKIFIEINEQIKEEYWRSER